MIVASKRKGPPDIISMQVNLLSTVSFTTDSATCNPTTGIGTKKKKKNEECLVASKVSERKNKCAKSRL